MRTSLARPVWVLVGGILGVALVTTAWFVARTIAVRVPYWGEAEVLFEASRIRDGLPLYVDPLSGAREYGEPPSRFYVTYPPLWSGVVSLLPAGAACVGARIACTVAWFGTLGALVWKARRTSRLEAGAAAAFVAGIWVLANFATVGRPDSIACALAAAGLARAIRKGCVDVVSTAALVLAPWVKPTILGLPAGALAGAMAADRAQGQRTLAVAAILAGASVVVAYVSSGGALFAHVVLSNAQPFTLDGWLDQVPSRAPFFLPLFAWAWWVGWRDRQSPGARIGLAALAGAVVWTLFALAKTGSSSNYWMEPCVAAVALVAGAAPGPLRIGQGRVEHALAVLVAVAWADTASVRAAIEHVRTERADASFVAEARARCQAGPDDVVAADEAGIELAANGRILVPTYQMVHLVRRTQDDVLAAAWREDLRSPRIRCFVERSRQLDLVPEVKRGLVEGYEVVASGAGGIRLWKKR
jgi:hypothetical protein